MKKTWIDNVRAAFVAEYGPQEGTRISRVVMPGILADFRKRLEKAFPGVTVEEDYHLEHTKTVVLLRGRKQTRDGRTELLVTELSVDGRPVELVDLLTDEPVIRL
ncbi:MAG: hypothetical protein IJH75_01250 [Mogibacterium sp.]|nr:hypothetical protein [Mogibacterium sp.]